MRYFNLIFCHGFKPDKSEGNQFEKVVSAPSEEYIREHKSKFLGQGTFLMEIDTETYKDAKTEEDVDQIMEKRFGYKIVDGVRVYD